MSFERRLILNRWLHHRFGSRSTDEVLDRVRRPGPGDGESVWLRALLRTDEIDVDEDRLRVYDERVLGYQTRLAATRGGFAWKPFQYLALLYSELLLDELTADPKSLVSSLNAFLDRERRVDPALEPIDPFEPTDLRRFAFFMATGSGKTLVMHANVWQVLHYLRHGAHPEALVDWPDGRNEFDNLLLITPTETLSRQHLAELRNSGIAASHLAFDADGSGWLFEPPVRVIEISKLRPAEDVSGEGLSVAIEALGGHNLVLVDEGHKGTGSEARTWKARQDTLAAGGMLLEYSATFAQAVATAGRRRPSLEVEYGKAIVFDYSYRHFHDDGYGKDFDVLNLTADQEEHAHELLIGGLLTFYQQLELFEEKGAALRPFNIERPLWVFLGSSVIKGASRDLADVAIVVAFLKRFLEDAGWARKRISKVLTGDSGFEAQGEDLFLSRLDHLEGRDPEALYEDILRRIFRGRGGLEVWEVKNADGELGLAVSGGEDGGASYFGVINVGDSRKLARHLEDQLGLEVKPDEIRSSLFEGLGDSDSRIHLLVGSRKFIEGWSSWRVSSMSLLNMGKGAGPQVIQLFGRGVRLKGRDMSLRRSTLPGYDPDSVPEGLKHLETLYISGWNAEYMATFRKMLEEEEVAWEEEVPVHPLFEEDSALRLLVPRPQDGYDTSRDTWELAPESLSVVVDRAPRVRKLVAGAGMQTATVETRVVGFSDPAVIELLDIDRLYLDLVAYKQAQDGYGNLRIRRHTLLPMLQRNTLRLPEADHSDPEAVQQGALELLRACLDRFVARRERESESSRMRPVQLEISEALVPYRVRGASIPVRDQVRALLQDRDELLRTQTKGILPRLHIERHLFSPLLMNPKEAGNDDVRISPAGLVESEVSFLKDLVSYWTDHAEANHPDEHLWVLRNLPHRGVGFFRRSGFYPDFLLWLLVDDRQKLRFIEPHGMHHGGLKGNESKIEAFLTLTNLNADPEFAEAGVEVDGYIVTETERSKIADAENIDDDELREDYRVLFRTGGGVYLRRILS